MNKMFDPRKLVPYLLAYSVLLLTLPAQADDTFRSVERFEQPANLPFTILSAVTKHAGAEKMAYCKDLQPNTLFEASIVHLNKTARAFLVKPTHICLCQGGACPMWIYQAKGDTAKLIWNTHAASTLEVQDKTLNKYRKLKAFSASPTAGHETVWSWDKDSYTEIYKYVWTWNAEQNCRIGEETTQLMDGKMVQFTKKCLSN